MWCWGFGNGRVEAAGPKPVCPLTFMLGTEGVTDIDGALILGPLAGVGDSLTEIIGISGVTEIEGALILPRLFGAEDSLTEMLGIGGVTPIDGTFTPLPRVVAPLTVIDGVSEIEIVGMEDAETGVERVAGD